MPQMPAMQPSPSASSTLRVSLDSPCLDTTTNGATCAFSHEARGFLRVSDVVQAAGGTHILPDKTFQRLRSTYRVRGPDPIAMSAAPQGPPAAPVSDNSVKLPSPPAPPALVTSPCRNPAPPPPAHAPPFAPPPLI